MSLRPPSALRELQRAPSRSREGNGQGSATPQSMGKANPAPVPPRPGSKTKAGNNAAGNADQNLVLNTPEPAPVIAASGPSRPPSSIVPRPQTIPGHAAEGGGMISASVLDAVLDLRPRGHTASGRLGIGRVNEEEEEEVLAGRLEELRGRWRQSREEQQHWQRDVQQSMARWSLQRARIEEEITRRQEASRFATSAPRFHSGQWPASAPSTAAGAPRPASALTLSVGAEHSGNNCGSSSEDDSDTSSQSSMSPYTDRAEAFNGYRPTGTPYWVRSRPVSAGSVLERKVTAVEAEDLHKALQRKGVPMSLDKMTRALVAPEDKSYEECVARLPRPGSHLLSGGVSAKDSKKGKKAKKGSGKKRAGVKKKGKSKK